MFKKLQSIYTKYKSCTNLSKIYLKKNETHKIQKNKNKKSRYMIMNKSAFPISYHVVTTASHIHMLI